MTPHSEVVLEAGRKKLAEARRNRDLGLELPSRTEPSGESHLRDALKEYWSAMNHLEGTAEFDVAHDELHAVGRTARERFPAGCRLDEADDGSFVQRCPVPLAHKRFGFSIGATGNAICSICWTDASECPHVPDRTYEVTAERFCGYCNICAGTTCEEHVEGHRYSARLTVIVTELEVQEISLVQTPAFPDARLTEIPIASEILEGRLGRLPAGSSVVCDQCLGECPGFDARVLDNSGQGH